ncbi:MAG: glycosyltransferase family 4 protein [Pseudomonadales bacterium]|nr:glycosyltransferase family 4 protein [Pseudomonadales bacterium]
MVDSSILHVVRRFVFSEWGGTETVVWNSALKLLALSTPTSIISTSALDSPGVEQKSGCKIERFPYIYPRLGLNSEKRIAMDKKGGDPYSLSLFIALLKSHCAIYHCHSMQRIAAMVRIAARARNVPYILSLHGGQYTVPRSEIADMAKSTKNTLNYGRFLDVLSRPDRVLEDAGGIICVGYDEYEVVKKRFPFKPTIYLPNGVNSDAYSGDSVTGAHNDGVENGDREVDGGRFRKQHKIADTKTIILCVSRIDPQKNQLALVELMANLNARKGTKKEEKTENNGVVKDYHLVLVGPCTNVNYLDQIVATIAQRDLKESVTLISGLQPESIALKDVYQSADIFVLPSVHEPFGIVVLEAWAAGLPVIASRLGGLAKLIDDQKNGLHFNPFKPSSLFDVIVNLEKNPLLEKRIGARGQKEAKTQYSWENYTKRLVQFYEDVERWHRSKASKALNP